MDDQQAVPLYARIIGAIFYIGPLLFAFGFIAPLTAEIIRRADWAVPFGLTPLTAGLALAAILGSAAQFRGRWI